MEKKSAYQTKPNKIPITKKKMLINIHISEEASLRQKFASKHLINCNYSVFFQKEPANFIKRKNQLFNSQQWFQKNKLTLFEDFIYFH